MDSNNHIANVIMIDFSNYGKSKIRKSFVVPGHLEAYGGDVITWESKDSNATFFFPSQELFGKKEFQVDKGDILELTVQEKIREGSYPYAVFTNNNDFAEGGSFPRIIIKR